MILPNTFLIGAQKAATTSVYSWISQHPNICGPMAVKDYGFFTRDDFFNKGFSSLSSFYEEVYKNEEIIIQGSVHYIYFEKALERIKEFNPDAKFILLLRSPIDRAISAYEYAVKFNYEDLPIYEAFSLESKRLLDDDIQVLSQLTYKHHGLYFKQIQSFLKLFKREQLEIVLYEDISKNPEQVVKNIFSFLGVDPNIELNFKSFNVTGEVKSKEFQKVVFGNGTIRNFLVQKVLKKILPHKFTAKLKWKIIDLNTKDKKSNYLNKINEDLREELFDFFREDIDQLEQFLSRDLSHWKK